jgi:hypothetical protein
MIFSPWTVCPIRCGLLPAIAYNELTLGDEEEGVASSLGRSLARRWRPDHPIDNDNPERSFNFIRQPHSARNNDEGSPHHPVFECEGKTVCTYGCSYWAKVSSNFPRSNLLLTPQVERESSTSSLPSNEEGGAVVMMSSQTSIHRC